jgi:hypothetical protein
MSRSTIGMWICALSAMVLGYFCFIKHLVFSPALTCSLLFGIWSSVAEWLSGQSKRLWGATLSEVHQAIKRGELRKTGIALGIERMSFVWLAAAVVIWVNF